MVDNSWQDWPNATWVTGIRERRPEVEEALGAFLLDRAAKLARRYDVSDQENLAQESVLAAFLRIRASVDTFRGTGSFLGWSQRVLQTAMLDQVRTLGDAGAVISIDRQIDGRPAIESADPTAPAALDQIEVEPALPNPVELARLEALEVCVGRLSERERVAILAEADIFHLLVTVERYYKLRWQREEQRARAADQPPDEAKRPPKRFDLPERRSRFEDAAAELGIKTEQIYGYVTAARKKLRRCLAERGVDG